MKSIVNRIKAQIPAREEGQGVVEYTLVLGVLVVAIFTAFQLTGIGPAITGGLADLIALF